MHTVSYVTVPQWYLGSRCVTDLPRHVLYFAVPPVPTKGHVTYEVGERGQLREVAANVDSGD